MCTVIFGYGGYFLSISDHMTLRCFDLWEHSNTKGVFKGVSRGKSTLFETQPVQLCYVGRYRPVQTGS